MLVAASRSLLVEGFIVWPPLTTTSAPRLSRIARVPSPAATVTTPMAAGRAHAAASSRRLGRSAAVCEPHVVDVDLGDLAELQYMCENGTGIVGVDVDLEGVRIADDQLGAARRGDVLVDGGPVEVVPVQEELGAVQVLVVVPVVLGFDRSSPVRLRYRISPTSTACPW